MEYDYALSGRIYIDGGLVDAALGIKDGKISAVKKQINGAKDYGSNIILPARTDPHVHFRDPGFTQKEDFFTGTLSAAFGGVSCVLDMPNTNPFVYRFSSLEEKEHIASRKAVIDYGLYVGMSGNIVDEKALKRSPALKIFMAPTTGGVVNGLDDVSLQYLLNIMADYPQIAVFHAEDPALLGNSEAHSLEEHMKKRPSAAEESAVKRLLSTEKELHIAHISSREGAEALRQKREGQTAEITPSHLFLTADMDFENPAYARVNPPVRTKKDRDALWNALTDGRIDMVSSDHAPHTIDEKAEFERAPSGIPGVETALPLIMASVRKGLISFERAVEVLIENPAKRFCPQKGSIREGNDADLIVIDMKAIGKIDAEKLHSRAGWTPFEGMDAIFPSELYVRGEHIIKNGSFEGEKGFGRNPWFF